MSKKKFGVIFAAVLFAALVAVLIWYVWGNGKRDGADRVYVEKVSAVMGNMNGAQNRYSGVVEPQKTVDINTDSERTVKDVLVKVGDKVEVGTPLFNYDTDELTMELEQAKLELENQDIEIRNFKTQIAELEKEKKAAAEEDKFEYTTQIQTLETQIRQAEFEKSSKQLEIDKLQKKVDDSEVVSTAEGTIKSINDGESEMMDSSSSAFMTILSTGDYRIKGTVNEQNVWLLSDGADVIVRSRVDEEITWTGRIESIAEDEPTSSSENDMDMGYGEGENAALSSSYPFYVTMDTTEGLMLGQHVLIELDQGQMDEKDGIWLYSGYILFEDEDGNTLEKLETDTENLGDFEAFEGFEALEETELSAGADFLEDIYFENSTETPMEISGQTAYVWADDGNGRLEKRSIVLGEYDAELDEYEVISGLTADDLIAWPMEGLYEGIVTVTSMDDIDYSSGLYQQMGTEELWYDTESGMMYDDMMMDDMMMDEEFDEDYYDDDFEEDYYDDEEDMRDAEVSE